MGDPGRPDQRRAGPGVAHGIPAQDTFRAQVELRGLRRGHAGGGLFGALDRHGCRYLIGLSRYGDGDPRGAARAQPRGKIRVAPWTREGREQLKELVGWRARRNAELTHGVALEMLPQRLQHDPLDGGAVDGKPAAFALHRDRVMLQQGEQGAELRLLPSLGLGIAEQLDSAGEVRRKCVRDEHPVTAK